MDLNLFCFICVCMCAHVCMSTSSCGYTLVQIYTCVHMWYVEIRGQLRVRVLGCHSSCFWRKGLLGLELAKPTDQGASRILLSGLLQHWVISSHNHINNFTRILRRDSTACSTLSTILHSLVAFVYFYSVLFY